MLSLQSFYVFFKKNLSGSMFFTNVWQNTFMVLQIEILFIKWEQN